MKSTLTFMRLSVASLIICSFILSPLSTTLQVKKAEAAIGYDPYNTIVNALSMGFDKISSVAGVATQAFSGITAAAQKSLAIKEFGLDTIAWKIGNIVLKEMIRSTTKWVNSGFKGSPAFVTDLEGFLLDIADKVAGNFIWGSGLQFLCSPFKLNIQLALDAQYRGARSAGYVAQCRLSTIIKNVDQFLAGDFMQGGWGGWHSLTLNEENNPYGAMMVAQAGIGLNINNKKGERIKMLDFGKGFKGVEECWDDELGGQRCSMVTPGTAIESQLNLALGLPMQRLAVADELNELIDALFSQLAKEALGGIGGLLGLTETRSGYGGGGSYGGNYFTRLQNETVGNNTPQVISNQPFLTEISELTRYRGLQQMVVSIINDASGYRVRAYGDRFESDDDSSRAERCRAGGELTSSLQSQRTAANREIASSTNAITRLTTLMNDYNTLQGTTTSSSSIRTLLQTYRASTTPDAQLAVLSEYTALQSQYTTLPVQSSTLEISSIPDLRTAVAAFTATVDTACTQIRNSNAIDYVSGV